MAGRPFIWLWKHEYFIGDARQQQQRGTCPSRHTRRRPPSTATTRAPPHKAQPPNQHSSLFGHHEYIAPRMYWGLDTLYDVKSVESSLQNCHLQELHITVMYPSTPMLRPSGCQRPWCYGVQLPSPWTTPWLRVGTTHLGCRIQIVTQCKILISVALLQLLVVLHHVVHPMSTPSSRWCPTPATCVYWDASTPYSLQNWTHAT